MEKVEKALAFAVDNAARIESTARLLRSHLDGVVKVMNGTVVNGNTQFGTVGAGGGVIVAFSGASSSLYIGGVKVASGESPLIAAVESGGELLLIGSHSGAVAMAVCCNK